MHAHKNLVTTENQKVKQEKNAPGLALQYNHCLCAHFGVLVLAVG